MKWNYGLAADNISCWATTQSWFNRKLLCNNVSNEKGSSRFDIYQHKGFDAAFLQSSYRLFPHNLRRHSFIDLVSPHIRTSPGGFLKTSRGELSIKIAFFWEHKSHSGCLLKPSSCHKMGLKQILFHPSLINNLKWLIAACDRECIAVVDQIAAVWGLRRNLFGKIITPVLDLG